MPKGLLTTAVGAGLLTGCLTAIPAAAAPTSAAGVNAAAHAQKITFGSTTCAPSWHAPNPGTAHFAVANNSSRPATVYFVNAVSLKVLAKITKLPAHSSRPMTAKVKANKTYQWGCDLIGGTRHTSETQTVPAEATHGGPGRQVPPLQVESAIPELRKYRTYVGGQIKTLVQQVSTLQIYLTLLDQTDAENAWLTAHETWLKIGQDDGQYSAFGNLGLRIDGTAAGLPNGTADPKFTGFHKVELDLWGHGDLAAAATDTRTLAGYVKTLSKTSLVKALPGNKAGIANWILRTHEITEDMVRDTLSGNDDYGSGTGMASVTADVSATREILGLLAPFLNPRSPHLVSTARAQLGRLMTLAHGADHNGSWTGIAELTRGAREKIDAAADAADETLAPVPDLLRITGT